MQVYVYWLYLPVKRIIFKNVIKAGLATSTPQLSCPEKLCLLSWLPPHLSSSHLSTCPHPQLAYRLQVPG